MSVKTYISFLAFTIIILISVINSPGCANIVPPSGGFRDSLPPVLVRSTPVDSTRNFKENHISLVFDEYVDIDNFQQNVIVSPIPKIYPMASRKLNVVTVRLRDTLEPNTTYSINFGNTIKDFNEGNVMKDFTYVFSTGPSIDSFSFRGSVILAESGKIDSTLIVILHKNANDSAVMKERPRYMAKLNKNGDFVFHNLPAGTFYLYAMKDEAKIFRYGRGLFAFADSAVVVGQNPSPKTIYAYEQTKDTRRPTTGGGGTPSATDKRLKFQTSVKGRNAQDLLQPFYFQFDRPLRHFDSSKIHFASDSTFNPVTGYSWSLDTTKKKLTLHYTWQENTLYHLILDKEFATDTMGYQLLRADTMSFSTLKNADYGKLSIRLRNLDLSTNPVLQFIQNNEVVGSFPLTSPNFAQALFLPGEYELRLLKDDNKNGVWDGGDFFGKHRQPEIVKPIDRAITVKPNWENEFEIAL